MNKQILKKLVVGTVQLGSAYGIANIKSKVPNKKEKDVFFQFLKKNNLNRYDTAPGYHTEKLIGSYYKEKNINLEIYSKIPSLKKIQNKKKFVEFCIKKSLKNLNSPISKFFFHDPEDFKFITKNSSYLNYLKKKFKIKNFGISLYELSENRIALINKYNIDVQLPVNLTNFKKIKLNKLKVEIFVRSIFLQGLLVNKKIQKKLITNELNLAHKEYFKFLKLNRFDPLNLNLNFILGLKKIHKVIIGFNSMRELNKILKIKKKVYKKRYFSDVYNIFKNINTDPRLWNEKK